MAQNLYLIEVLIQEVFYDGEEIDKYDINVNVKLGRFADFDVQFEEKTEVFNMKLANPGKSYLFPANPYVLKHEIMESKIKFTVCCLVTPQNIIGEASMSWPYPFRKLVEHSENDKNLLPATHTEQLDFDENYEHTGHIKVFMRLSCFGPEIQTQYQVVQTKDEAMSYLFKGSKIPTAFQSPNYGHGGSNDLLAVGPLFSHKDKGPKPSNYSLDITESEIEATLCKDEDCLAAYKFKEFGIGPLAKKKKVFKSPCGGPECQFAYEVGAPPCVGHRKCKFNTPLPMQPKSTEGPMYLLNDYYGYTGQYAPQTQPVEQSQNVSNVTTQSPPNCGAKMAPCPQKHYEEKSKCFPPAGQDTCAPQQSQSESCPYKDCPFDHTKTNKDPQQIQCPSNMFRNRAGGLGAAQMQTDVEGCGWSSCKYKEPTLLRNERSVLKEQNINTCCGKANCKIAKKCRNPNCKIHGSKLSSQTNEMIQKEPITYCESCGGYSISGKTCKDLQLGSDGNGYGLAHNINDFLRIQSADCFCSPGCQPHQDKNLQTILSSRCETKNQADNRKSTNIIQMESSNSSNCYEKGDGKKLNRLKSGASSIAQSEPSGAPGVSPVSGKPLTSSEGGAGGDDRPKRKKCNLVYHIGDTYPGNKIGHKQCSSKIPACPATKGWEWYPEPSIPPLKPRREYRPGFISKEVQQQINEIREAAGLVVIPTKAPKKKKSKKSKSGGGGGGGGTAGGVSSVTADDEDEGDEEYEVEDKNAIEFTKTTGTYFIKYCPLRDPKKVADNEDPYINCPPIEIKYMKDALKQMMKGEDVCDCCTCMEDEMSDEDDDVNVNFSPPMGVIEMERMKKHPNVVHFWTQYDPVDFGCPPVKPPASEKKGKKK